MLKNKNYFIPFNISVLEKMNHTSLHIIVGPGLILPWGKPLSEKTML